MTINIKTLHIGSHVCVDGKHVRICGITKRKVGYHATGKPCGHLRYARLNEVEPIPITPELLEELGFSVKEPYIRLENETQSLISQSIEFLYISKIGHYELTFRKRYEYASVFTCRYLHEAEAFLALYGVELIKE